MGLQNITLPARFEMLLKTRLSKNKSKRYKKAEADFQKLKRNPMIQKLAKLPKKNIEKPITRKEAFELIEIFKEKGMSVQWIKDAMLVFWKIENSKDLKRWQFEQILKLVSSVKDAKEFRHLLIDVDVF
jgi:hypothetical protein